jgi:hypothetical protein
MLTNVARATENSSEAGNISKAGGHEDHQIVHGGHQVTLGDAHA